MIQYQTHAACPTVLGNITLTPQAQAFIVHLPGAAFVWNRPSAVLVEQNGVVKRLPILDVTRILQLGLLALPLLFLLSSVLPRRQKETLS